MAQDNKDGQDTELRKQIIGAAAGEHPFGVIEAKIGEHHKNLLRVWHDDHDIVMPEPGIKAFESKADALGNIVLAISGDIDGLEDEKLTADQILVADQFYKRCLFKFQGYKNQYLDEDMKADPDVRIVADNFRNILDAAYEGLAQKAPTKQYAQVLRNWNTDPEQGQSRQQEFGETPQMA